MSVDRVSQTRVFSIEQFRRENLSSDDLENNLYIEPSSLQDTFWTQIC